MANAEIIDSQIVITLPVERVTAGLKMELEEYFNNLPIKVIPVKKLSQAQNGLIHVLLKEFGEQLGYTLLEIKELMKEQFAIATDRLDFSTARCDMQTANEFIAFIIEQALEMGVNLYILGKHDTRYKHILEIDNITQRYVIACLRKRTCCICGKIHDFENGDIVDLDHWNTISSSAGNYENDDGLQNPFIPLCREHHMIKHAIGKEEFQEKYIVGGVWLNEQLVYELLNKYPNHFKLFRKRLKEGYYDNLIVKEKIK
nr:MAG TPA: Putative HNHc nuclease [Caudoviricetes sp.]